MSEANEPVRDLVRRALTACAGDWHAAERLCHQWLADDPDLHQQIAQICVEWVIRNAITAEGRRQQQQEAERLREERDAAGRDAEIRQTVDELIELLRGKPGDMSGHPQEL